MSRLSARAVYKSLDRPRLEVIEKPIAVMITPIKTEFASSKRKSISPLECEPSPSTRRRKSKIGKPTT
jgi:hypothetical protein